MGPGFESLEVHQKDFVFCFFALCEQFLDVLSFFHLIEQATASELASVRYIRYDWFALVQSFSYFPSVRKSCCVVDKPLRALVLGGLRCTKTIINRFCLLTTQTPYTAYAVCSGSVSRTCPFVCRNLSPAFTRLGFLALGGLRFAKTTLSCFLLAHLEVHQKGYMVFLLCANNAISSSYLVTSMINSNWLWIV